MARIRTAAACLLEYHEPRSISDRLPALSKGVSFNGSPSMRVSSPAVVPNSDGGSTHGGVGRQILVNLDAI